MIPLGIVASARKSTGVVFTDNFNRADGAIGADWVNVVNTLVIASNAVKGSDGATNLANTATELASSDHYAKVVVTTVGGTSMGVMARMPGGAHTGYLWRYNGSETQLFKMEAGTATALGTAYSATLTAPFTLRIEVKGSTITGYIDGVQRQQVTDTGIATGTFCGIRIIDTTARLDDFEMGYQ